MSLVLAALTASTLLLAQTLHLLPDPAHASGLIAFLSSPAARLICFITLLGFFVAYIVLKRALRQMDSSAVVPERLRLMLDALTESVLVLDLDQKIILANGAFCRLVDKPPGELLGRRAADLPYWIANPPSALPWHETLQRCATRTATPMEMVDGKGARRALVVNCAPILGEEKAMRGALVTMADVTAIQEQNTSLQVALKSLEASREKIQQQNLELQALATTDPLTGCGNRRSLYTALEMQWASARRYGHSLSCVLVDVDHFKSINDQHGHSVGDRVLQQVGAVLRETARDSDAVYRYGGEEFIVVLPHTDIGAARQAAERLRQRVAGCNIEPVQITASFGVATADQRVASPQDMIEQADKALYAAKRAGRNRVVCYTETPGSSQDESQAVDAPVRIAASSGAIPFRAVTALMEVLSARDPATAQHCMRVADLCVLLGGEMMSPEQLYLLEVGAMLHDIGKLGVPDAVLLKPGPLDEQERLIMDAHDRLGVSIIVSALGSAELAKVVESHHAWFAGRAEHPDQPVGRSIPLAARIIAIVDAFDAMVCDRPYRPGLSRDAAFNELRRGAGTQFDPELVDQFIALGSRNLAIAAEAQSIAA